MKLLLFAATFAAAAAFAPVPSVQRSVVRPSTPTPLNSIKINLKPTESVDGAIMRLRREVNKSGHLRILRTKRYFEDPREKKKRKLAEARRKMKFARQLKRVKAQRGP